MTHRYGILLVQSGGLVLAFLLLALRPPATGPMLVIPLDGTSQASLLNITLREGGALLGQGPIPGSLLVYGSRASLEPAFRAAHAVALAATAPLCGALMRSSAGKEK